MNGPIIVVQTAPAKPTMMYPETVQNVILIFHEHNTVFFALLSCYVNYVNIL